jgi:hypothetical protein
MCSSSIVISRFDLCISCTFFPAFIITLKIIIILSAKSQVWKIGLITVGYKAD